MPASPTIAAIATGPAAGGIGIVRVSGSQSLAVARKVCPSAPATLPARQAVFTSFVDAHDAVLDEGLVLYFPGPNSYTGEDVVEFQLHGSPRLLQLLLTSALQVDRVRLAEPGEFTRRAFLNGRIDLTRAEAVADLIAASSERAVLAAARQLAGGLFERIERLRAPLVELQADLEASLDFPDEAEDAEVSFAERLDECVRAVRALRDEGASGAVIRRGAKVVLYGPVNAGKSTLFNRLVGEARAIVDSEPGTTRDALEARLELNGLSVTLTDTAGLREAPGRIEAIGIERTRSALAACDVAVLVMPPNASAAERAAWQREADPARRIDVDGKADVARPNQGQGLAVSGHTGLGVDELRSAVMQKLAPGEATAVSVTSERHLACLTTATEALTRARTALTVSTLEVVAGEVAVALTALGDVTGRDVSADLLDAIFQRFCIGK